MKSHFLLFLLTLAGCSSSGPTEINRPPADVARSRQLILKTVFDPTFGVPFASAEYHDGSHSGFGVGVLVTCNQIVIVDTRNGGSGADTGRYLNQGGGEYLWEYQGLDTSFSYAMPAHTSMFILLPTNGRVIDLQQPFTVIYSPASNCTSLHVVLKDSLTVDMPKIQFDTTTGVIQPVRADSGVLHPGVGTITVLKTNAVSASSTRIHSIIIEDSIISQQQGVRWF